MLIKLNTMLQMSQILNLSPLRRQRRNVHPYISSSSAKRRQRKFQHCNYCVRFCHSREGLEDHLRASEACFGCYCRSLRCNSYDGVMIALYRCLFCNNHHDRRLHSHLQQSPECQQKYIDRFRADSLRCVFILK